MKEQKAFGAMRRVVITGMGVVSPNGIGKDAFCCAVLAGKSGVRRITRFDPSDLPLQIAGEVSDFDEQAWVTAHSAATLDCNDIGSFETSGLLLLTGPDYGSAAARLGAAGCREAPERPRSGLLEAIATPGAPGLHRRSASCPIFILATSPTPRFAKARTKRAHGTATSAL